MVWDPLKYDSFSLSHNFFFFEVLFFNRSFSLCLVSLYFYSWPSATSPDFCDNVFPSLEFSENCFCDCRFRVRQVSCWTSGSRWSADRKCKSRRQPAQAKTDADGHSRWWNVRIVMHLWKTSWHFRYPRSYAASPSRPCNEIEDVWLALIILVDWLKRNTPSYRSSKEQTLRFDSFAYGRDIMREQLQRREELFLLLVDKNRSIDQLIPGNWCLLKVFLTMRHDS